MEFDLDVQDGSAWLATPAETNASRQAIRLMAPGGGQGKLKRRRLQEDSYALNASGSVPSAASSFWNERFGPQPEGPKSPEDLHSWPGHIAEAMRLAGGASLRRLRKKCCEQPLTVTTTYSGTGAAEESTCHSMRCMAEVLGTPTRVRCYSACDPAPEAQQALLHHDSESKPEHIFDSVTDRIPTRLLHRLERCRQLWKSRAMRRMPVGATAKQRREVVDRHEQKFLSAAQNMLPQYEIDLQKTSFCRVHLKQCNPHPGDNAGFTVEVAGTTCVAFSSMAKEPWRWLDASAIPCLAWIFYIMARRPRMVVHECVPGFDLRVLKLFLGVLYNIMSLVFCLSDIGLPATRRRRYTLLLLKPLHFELPFDMNHFSRLAFRKQVADARIFFNADNQEQKEIYAEMCAKANLTETRVNGRYFSWHTLVSRGCHRRLMTYAKAAVQEHGLEKVPFLVINIAQRQEWVGHMRSVAPALLRHSNIWLLMSDRQARPALPSELLRVQCFPIPPFHGLAQGLNPTGAFNAWRAGRINSRQVVKLAGNAMNQAAVGSVVLFGLGCCGYDDDP